MENNAVTKNVTGLGILTSMQNATIKFMTCISGPLLNTFAQILLSGTSRAVKTDQ